MAAIRFVLALAAGLLFILPATAAELRGRITRVDLAKKEMVVEGVGRFRGEKLTVTLDPKTQVLFGARPAALEDLVSGRRALIRYEDRGGRSVARVVRVRGPLPALALRPLRAAGNAVAGKLLRVARTDREVVVGGMGPKGETETTVAVPEKVRITRNGKALTLDDLKEGELVTIRVEKRAGQLTAMSIQVGVAAAMTSPGERIQRVRRVLKVIDTLLEQAARNREDDR